MRYDPVMSSHLLVEVRGPESAADEAALRIHALVRDVIAEQGAATVALSGGQTYHAVYSRLATLPVDWKRVLLFWVDERAVPPSDPRSNYFWVRQLLVTPAHVDERRLHRMVAEGPDLEAQARAYEAQLRAMLPCEPRGVPVFDLVVLGIGEDGHTASLFPGTALLEEADRYVAAVPADGGREARLTLTPAVLQAARSIVVLVVGAQKRAALDRVWAGGAPGPSDVPARLLRGARGTVIWVVDHAALPKDMSETLPRAPRMTNVTGA